MALSIGFSLLEFLGLVWRGNQAALEQVVAQRFSYKLRDLVIDRFKVWILNRLCNQPDLGLLWKSPLNPIGYGW